MEFFGIAVCTLYKVTVNYVCCHYTIPLCCPGELPGKLTLFKQDGWFFLLQREGLIAEPSYGSAASIIAKGS